MKWLPEDDFTLLQKFVCNVLKAGSIPGHLALIMDGNRRHAKENNLNLQQNYFHAFGKLKRAIFWCLYMGIKELTVFAFSTEHFKRKQEEVDAVINVFRAEAKIIVEARDEMKKIGLCWKVWGDPSHFDDDVQFLMAEIQRVTKDNNKIILNMCVAYTAREEISLAVKEMAIGVEQGLLFPSDVNTSLLENCLFSNKSLPVYLLIRTSGECRLSDFILWQSAYSPLLFVDPYWPLISNWMFLKFIFFYQRQTRYQRILKNEIQMEGSIARERDEGRVKYFLEHLERKRNEAWNEIHLTKQHQEDNSEVNHSE